MHHAFTSGGYICTETCYEGHWKSSKEVVWPVGIPGKVSVGEDHDEY